MLNGGSAHMEFEEAINAFPDDYINRKPPNVSYSFWHLLEHMRTAQWDILEFVRKPGHMSPDWPDKFWPPKNKLADRERWEKTLDSIRSDLASIREIVRNPETDFFSTIPHAKEYNTFVNCCLWLTTMRIISVNL